MKKSILIIVGAMAVSTMAFLLFPSSQIAEFDNPSNEGVTVKNEEGKKLEPHDQWMTIRSYPEGFDQSVYLERIEEIKTHELYAADNRAVELGLDWKEEGPGNIGGRIDVLTVHPTDQDIIYAGATNGGVFKTEDGGSSWEPIFDDQPYLSIGAIAIDPVDPRIVYVGTGDRNFTGSSFIGNGIYKSINSGEDWEQIGLEATGVVSEIIVNPVNPDRIFASTLGNPHEKNTDRGVYRSDDGGETWSSKLFLSDSSGVSDLIMDPTNPSILFAAGYNRMRNYFSSVVSGPAVHVYKSIDNGDSWVQLEGGLPDDNDCRIGLAISHTDPAEVYALYVGADNLDVKEIYKTSNGGSTWSPLNVHDGAEGLPISVMGGFGWYFGEVYLNPYNDDQLIVPGVDMYQSLDGGDSWALNVPEWWTYEVHADKHCIAFLDEDSYIIGTDGGLYKTDNNGVTWTDIENLPITQFYHIAVDPNITGRYGGGAQDNGSMAGNAESFNSWERLYGGDGFRVTFLEEDAGAAYYETQNGGLRYADPDGGTSFLSPLAEGEDRINWDMPYLVNENNAELFAGSARMQLMEGAPYNYFNYISDDLTRVGLGEVSEGERYHTLTEIDQPYSDENLLYVGTTDGLVWKGVREGDSWSWINITGDLPNRYVTGVRCSPNKPGTVYITFSGYKVEDDLAYVYKTEDYGATWISISSDLPNITVNDILIVPGYDEDEYLFTALDGGVYFSENNGESWDYLGAGLPFATVSELALDFANERLIAGTYSRSMWSYDVSWMEEIDDVDDSGLNTDEMNKIITYPNPANDNVYFKSVEQTQVSIYSVNGEYVLTRNIVNFGSYSSISVADLKTGIYFFQAGNSIATIIKN